MYLGRQKKQQIALNKLMSAKHMGGLNFPNIRSYNLVCLFRHVIHWANETDFFSYWELEEALAFPWHPFWLLHTKFAKLPHMAKTSVLLRDNIITPKEIRKKLVLPHLVSKNMPLWSHPEFPQGQESPMFQMLRSRNLKAGQLFHQ